MKYAKSASLTVLNPLPSNYRVLIFGQRRRSVVSAANYRYSAEIFNDDGGWLRIFDACLSEDGADDASDV